MALLGLFSRKPKAKHSDGSASKSTYSGKSEAASVLSSASTEYIPVDNSLPHSPNGRSSLHPNDMVQSKVYPNAGASSSRLRLPFSKKSSTGSSTSSIPRSQHAGDPLMATPRPSYGGRKSMSAASDFDEQDHLRLPPSKSQIFSESDHSRSTRSLPDGGPNSPASQLGAKKNNKFPWNKSAPSPPVPVKMQTAPPAIPRSPDQDLSSFNLKSFRSAQSPSPIHSNASNTSLSPPVPPMARPRNASVSSDTSQRISVAAFREAQARRSAAGSPSPSSHPPSPVTRNAAPRSRSRNAMNAPRKSTLLYSSESEESSEETDSDQQGAGHSTIGRKRTVKQARSTTDLNSASYDGTARGRATRSEMGHGFAPSSSRQAITASSENLSHHTRQSSAMTARTITQAAAEKPQEASDSDDDAPLATLVPPRRPGSALSSLSGTPPMKPKPLIDITELTGPNRKPVGFIPPTGEDAGFTSGSTLLSSGKTPLRVDTNNKPFPSPHIQDLANSPLSYSKTPPGGRFVSPPSSPERKAHDVSPVPPPPSVSPAFGRKIPVTKRSTDPTTPEPSEQKRPLNERLNKVVHSATTSPAAAFVVPPPAPPKPQAEKIRLPAGPGHSRNVSTGMIPGEETTQDLAAMLGAGVRLISFNGEEPSPESERPSRLPYTSRKGPASTASTSDEESSEGESSEEAGKTPVALAPVPIQRRAAPSGFSVTSRPQHKQNSASTSLLNSTGSGSSSLANNEPTQTSASSLRPRSSSVDLSTALSGGKRSPEVLKPKSGEASNPFAKSFGKASPSTRMDADSPTMRARSRTVDPSNSRPDFDKEKQTAKTMVPDVPKSKTTYSTSAKPSGPNASRSPATSMNVNTQSQEWRTSTSTLMAPNGGQLSSLEQLPRRPFAARPSPASSATGDSSSGRGAPMTPRDGSSVDSESDHVQIVRDSNGPPSKWSGGVSGLGLNKKQLHRRSVSYDDEASQGKLARMLKMSQESSEQQDQRRNDRRRNEARAAIELGNVINGRGPILDEDEDEDDVPINQAMAGRGMNMNQMMPGQMPMAFPNMNSGQQSWNPMMNMGMAPGQWSPQMGMPGQMPMLSPNQFMMPPPNDPSMYAAHQQAMMMAKQAYQMAVAQQAIAAAGEEWERGSVMGGSVMGGSVMGGSVVGGPSAGRASTYSNASPPFMMPGMGMNMGGGSGAWSSNGSMLGVGPSMFSSAQSEYGGGGGGARNWSSSRSAYGESFDQPQARSHKMSQPSRSGGRDSGYSQYNLPPMPPMPQQQNVGRGNGGQRGRTVSQPAHPAPGSPSKPGRRAPPPSSWKA